MAQQRGILGQALYDYVVGDKLAHDEAMRQQRAQELNYITNLANFIYQQGLPLPEEQLPEFLKLGQKYNMQLTPAQYVAQQTMSKNLLPDVKMYGAVSPDVAQQIAAAPTMRDVAQILAGSGDVTQKLLLAQQALQTIPQTNTQTALSTQPQSQRLYSELFTNPQGFLSAIAQGTGQYGQQVYNRDIQQMLLGDELQRGQQAFANQLDLQRMQQEYALRWQEQERQLKQQANPWAGFKPLDFVNQILEGTFKNVTSIIPKPTFPEEVEQFKDQVGQALTQAGVDVALPNLVNYGMQVGGLSYEDALKMGVRFIDQGLRMYGINPNNYLADILEPPTEQTTLAQPGGGQTKQPPAGVSQSTLPVEIKQKIMDEAKRAAKEDLEKTLSPTVWEVSSPEQQKQWVENYTRRYYAQILRSVIEQIKAGVPLSQVNIKAPSKSATMPSREGVFGTPTIPQGIFKR